MNYPNLVPPWVLTTKAKVVLTDGVTVSGAPKIVAELDLMCNFSEKTTRTLDEERRLITLSGALYFTGDIAPTLERFDGYVYINGGDVRREIYRGERGRNFDGTVNFTKLELV